jgi:DNA mismatch repair protein MutL
MIRVLDNETIDKIAAGEVVERPSSVVKELVENAIDAGASAITVDCKDGGIEYIRVTDNGKGIASGELRTAFLRHATSKIRNASDLLDLNSLGFRGEALSSICAVGKVEVITKTAHALTGTRMEIDGGNELSFSEVGAPAGTTMIVRNLFYNTPARRKFLKTSNTEGSYISDMLERIALSHPEISFQVSVNGKNRFHTSGNGNLQEVIYRIYGKEVASALIPVDTEKSGIRIRGFLGMPELVRSNRNFEIYFVNGRYVVSDLIAKSIEEGYREYLMLHRFPLCFLLFTLNPHRVDVNVHPTKQEVRIQDQNLFFATVSEEIHDLLRRREMLPGHVLETDAERKAREKQAIREVQSGKNPEPFEGKRREEVLPKKPVPSMVAEGSSYGISSASTETRPDPMKPVAMPETTGKVTIETEGFSFTEPVKQTTTEVPPQEPAMQRKVEIPSQEPVAPPAPEPVPVQTNLFTDRILTREHRKDFRIIGQVFECYWIIQYERKMMIIDQHAAHEKVNYERMVKRYREKNVLSQSLLPPIVLTLTAKEESMYLENAQAFTNIGFEVEHLGGSEYALRSVPVDLYGHSERELFLRVLEELADGNTRGSYKVIEEKIAGMACKASVKGGDKISLREAEALIDELLTLENPYNCPHGRPTIIVMSETELEKKFKRIVE